MKTKLRTAGGVLAILLLTSALGQRLIAPAWSDARRGEPALQFEQLESALGQGMLLGILGGFRTVIADFLWLRMNAAWESLDLAETHALVNLVTTVDPEPVYFWLNGARIIAYDMPVWRMRDHDSQALDAGARARIEREQGALAIAFLERAISHHPREPLLLLEVGNIYERKLGDPEMRARYYRRAAQLPGAPHYAARLYAELLRRLGRPAEAYAWLRDLHPKLSPKDPTALADVVLGRIRTLETQLGVPEMQRYVPPPGGFTN